MCFLLCAVVGSDVFLICCCGAATVVFNARRLVLVASSHYQVMHALQTHMAIAITLSSVSANWLILPVVICLSQRLSHACIRSHPSMVNLRMAH